MSVQRGAKGKRRYLMDYIPDKNLYKAVMFARDMIRKGTSPGMAIAIAARGYGYDVGEVARYVGQAGGTTVQRGWRKRRA